MDGCIFGLLPCAGIFVHRVNWKGANHAVGNDHLLACGFSRANYLCSGYPVDQVCRGHYRKGPPVVTTGGPAQRKPFHLKEIDFSPQGLENVGPVVYTIPMRFESVYDWVPGFGRTKSVSFRMWKGARRAAEFNVGYPPEGVSLKRVKQRHKRAVARLRAMKGE